MLPAYMTESRVALEECSRRAYQTARLSETDVLCRVLGRYIMYADPTDLCIVPHLCMDGYWESWITVALARLIRPGWHCVDVGANHGYFTLLMADAAGDAGRVLAVEPNPDLAARVSRSLEVNGLLGRATVLQRAAADEDGTTLSLVVPRRHGPDATVCRAATAEDDACEVESVTLDAATRAWPRVDLVKIDAEGAEPLVWAGMRALVGRHPGVSILMEFCPARYADARGFLREIRREGFRLRRVRYDAEIAEITEAEILRGDGGNDLMLFLRRD
jgi:FkbM family methyltransferase